MQALMAQYFGCELKLPVAMVDTEGSGKVVVTLVADVVFGATPQMPERTVDFHRPDSSVTKAVALADEHRSMSGTDPTVPHCCRVAKRS